MAGKRLRKFEFMEAAGADPRSEAEAISSLLLYF